MNIVLLEKLNIVWLHILERITMLEALHYRAFVKGGAHALQVSTVHMSPTLNTSAAIHNASNEMWQWNDLQFLHRLAACDS